MTKNPYSVGYGKPPRHSRFKPGRSGNPKGRPKCARGFSGELDQVLNELVQVTENGRTRKVRKQTAMIKSLVAKAMKGDPRSFQLILSNSDRLRGVGAMQASDLDAVDRLILEQFQSRVLKGGGDVGAT